jgi:archaellum component FlaG (FlaF/FlaG flagellin family)
LLEPNSIMVVYLILMEGTEVPGENHWPAVNHWQNYIFYIKNFAENNISQYKNQWTVVLDTTIYDKFCQWFTAGQWFSPGTSVPSINIK